MPPREPEKTEHEAASDLLETRGSGAIGQWRRDELTRMGFTDYQAEVLIHVPGLYTACIREKYINKGCPVELAWRILSPDGS